MEGMIKWFSRNHVAGNFLMLVILLAGVSSWFKLKKEVFPETSLDAVIISVPFPNATPEEVEDGILLPLEDAVADIDGIKRFTATATEGRGAMTVEVETGYNVRTVMDDVKSRVDAITIFPEESEKPIVEELVLSYQVMSVAVSAEADEKSLRKMAEIVRDGLLNYQAADAESFGGRLDQYFRGKPNITKVSLANVRPYEISIEISDAMLRRHGLTMSAVARALREASLDLPAGSISEKNGEVVLRVKGKVRDAQDFRDVVIVSDVSGEQLKLGDIATVVDGFEDVNLRARFDGSNAAIVNVYRTGDQDTSTLR